MIAASTVPIASGLRSPTTSAPTELPSISVVVIGRNEGQRLVRCFESLMAVDYPADKLELIYVDSQSSDDSCKVAAGFGARVIRITSGPLSAARGRNLGWRAACGELVHFVDGDTILDAHWFHKAVAKLQDQGIACVFGRCEELRPQQSIYMRVCSLDWNVPTGPARTCGGIALFRRDLLARLNGFCEEMVAGEEPELCYRVRQLGLQVWRLNEAMVLHDLHMTRFSQYWNRAARSGWAYLMVAARCWRGRERLWVRENLVNAAEVGVWAALLLAAVVMRNAWIGLALVCLVAVRVLWIAARSRAQADGWTTAILYGLHCQLIRLPIMTGQIRGVWSIITNPGKQQVQQAAGIELPQEQQQRSNV